MLSELGFAILVFIIAILLPRNLQKSKMVFSWFGIAISSIILVDFAYRVVAGESIANIANDNRPVIVQGVVTSPQRAPALDAEADDSVTVTRADGGSIVTDRRLLGLDALAKGSSLKREWIAVHHTIMPVSLSGSPGVKTIYLSEDYSEKYWYMADIEIESKQAVRAIEVRFLIFDVWGNYVRTLSYREVTDREAGSKVKMGCLWPFYSKDEAEQHYASIAYVAQVRLDDGTVLEAPTVSVVREAQKFSKKFTAKELSQRILPDSKSRHS